MRINMKSKPEKTVQRNLRVPVSLDEQMDKLTTRADKLSENYHDTLIDLIRQFNAEFATRLDEKEAELTQGKNSTRSGINPGGESLPGPVSPNGSAQPSSQHE
jgi:hypothetical protein